VRFIAKEWQNIKAPGNKVSLLLFRDNILYVTDVPLK
jgi:hypothetical protein